jgi:inorganic pyrophosphatase
LGSKTITRLATSAPIPLDHDFWESLDRLVSESRLVIDRPKGSQHPRYSDVIYPLDYGYLEGTTTLDGGGLDIWVGRMPQKSLTALVLTVDLLKRDIEIKLLLGCTQDEQGQILDFLNSGLMRAVKISR